MRLYTNKQTNKCVGKHKSDLKIFWLCCRSKEQRGLRWKCAAVEHCQILTKKKEEKKKKTFSKFYCPFFERRQNFWHSTEPLMSLPFPFLIPFHHFDLNGLQKLHLSNKTTATTTTATTTATTTSSHIKTFLSENKNREKEDKKFFKAASQTTTNSFYCPSGRKLFWGMYHNANVIKHV